MVRDRRVTGAVILQQTNFVSHYVDFTKHIPFFSIPFAPHTLHKYDLVYLDPFPNNVPCDSYISDVSIPHTHSGSQFLIL